MTQSITSVKKTVMYLGAPKKSTRYLTNSSRNKQLIDVNSLTQYFFQPWRTNKHFHCRSGELEAIIVEVVTLQQSF